MIKLIICVVFVVLLVSPIEVRDAPVPFVYVEPILHEAVIEVVPVVDAAPEILIYDIKLSEELQRYTYELCNKYDIVDYYSLVLAVMWQESNFTPNLISRTNDYGLMQINRVNHKWLANKLGIVDFLDAEQNIEAGVYLLSEYLHEYENEHRALMSYNFGVNGAARHWAAGTYSSKYSRAVTAKQELLQKE